MSPTAGLAVLNFFLADVHGGLGPFLATWLAAAEWSPARIGLVMTASGIAGLVFNGPAGALADRSGRPRLLLGLAAGAVVVGTLGMLPVHSFTGVMTAQIASAAGGAMMGPAMTALTLGLVGHRGFPRQQGRNEAWNHAGNVSAALVVAALAAWLGAVSAFWVLAGMAAGSILSLFTLRGAEIDLASAHGGAAPGALTGVLANPRLVALGCALLLFHLGNAAMLPLLGEHMAVIGHGEATRWMAACVITAQLGMIPVAVVAGRAAAHGSRVRLLAIACAVLAVRGVLAALADQPFWLIPVQILDACGAGLLGVAVPVLVADFTWGTGRTQTGLGAAATFQGIGAALSNTLGGALASWAGWGVAFLGLAGPAVLALGIALWLGGMQPGAARSARGA